jgi:hypothetical protein
MVARGKLRETEQQQPSAAPLSANDMVPHKPVELRPAHSEVTDGPEHPLDATQSAVIDMRVYVIIILATQEEAP